jgi:16S rRNA (adenine1518-N6/adenine1519-N6)-dimethyltransferase
LRSSSHQPRKRFGQHFLHDPRVLAKIVDALDLQPSDFVVEIGPGQGALTNLLVDRVEKLEVIEIDRDLAAALIERSIKVHQGDALEFDYSVFPPGARIVGNLPYNISSPLLFRLLECSASIVDIHVMLQREVVDRMIAAPGSPDYGRLSVMLGYRFHTQRLVRVPPGAFHPQPKVESAFARLRPIASPPVRARDERLFARIVALAFGQRRKTLRNTLSGVADEALLADAGVDPQARGETLSVEQFVTLANAVAAAARA